jgi:competence protein ComEC
LPCEDESLRLEWALTLGWKTALTPEVCEPFVQAATYHIFAVDGLRMAIVFGIFFGLFRALNVPRPISGLMLIPLIWFYVALTGWPASAIRATVMLTLVILSWSLNRPTDLLNSLYAAALLILVWQPQQLYQAGFQLSFLVVWCMILILPPLRASIDRLFEPDPFLPPQLHRRWPPYLAGPTRYLADLNYTSLAAWIGSIPLVAYYFNIVTPVSTPANVLAVPLCALVLISNLASLMLVAWFPAAAELFNHAGWFLMELIRVSSEWFARWPAAYWYVPAPSYLGIALYYVLVLGLAGGWLVTRHRWRLKLAVAVPLILAWGWLAWQDYRLTRLTLLPLNGGTAILCDYPGFRDDLLIDCGNTNAVTFTTKNFLRSQGVNRLPRFILTHGDLRHIGGARMIADDFDPGEICVSSNRFRSATYRQHLQAFEATPGLVRHVTPGDDVGRWEVLHPSGTNRFSRADDQALVLIDRFQGTRILLLSDLGGLGQDALMERMPDLRADIVIAGLPTSDEALSDPLLERLRPQAIIITDSEFPASERASAALRERLSKCGVPILYTRTAGAAALEFRGRQWTIRAMDGTRIAEQSRQGGSPSQIQVLRNVRPGPRR